MRSLLDTAVEQSGEGPSNQPGGYILNFRYLDFCFNPEDLEIMNVDWISFCQVPVCFTQKAGSVPLYLNKN